MKLQQCKCGMWCMSGYCSACRERDAVKARRLTETIAEQRAERRLQRKRARILLYRSQRRARRALAEWLAQDVH